MPTVSYNNRRIAKNAIMLYIRMFVMLTVGLYTSRVVVDSLGVYDYGIYNIIAGVVILFSFINNALTNATQRFLNYYLGLGNSEKVHHVFCMSMNVFFILSFFFVILAETLGLWFVNTHLNIPQERYDAALFVYQFSILTFVINLIRIPYNASIIAYEKMNFYAYISMIEAVLNLLVVYVLYTASYDKLILYACLRLLIPMFINLIYKSYCNKYFKTTKYLLLWNKNTFISLFSFSGWSLLGSLANMTAQQGINILINIFYGVTSNAAIGIANQVTSQVYQFVSNFQVAFQPQIVKSYAANEIENLNKLIFSSAKMSFYLMFIISLPLILRAQDILNLWLVEVPKNTEIFCQLILVFLMFESLSAPLWMTVQATGNIKYYQILVAILIFINFPLTFILYKLGMPVYTAWIIRILIVIITLLFRCIYLQKIIPFSAKSFIRNVIKPIIFVSIICTPISYIISINILHKINDLILLFIVLFILNIIVIYFIGIDNNEKKIVKNIINKFRK